MRERTLVFSLTGIRVGIRVEHNFRAGAKKSELYLRMGTLFFLDS